MTFKFVDTDVSTWREGEIFTSGRDNVNQYRLENLLGGGLTSLVWKASQMDADGQVIRSVALKVLRTDIGPEILAAFSTELEVLRTLWEAARERGIKNPPIPQVFDFSKSDAVVRYIAMELVEGKPATDLLGRQSNLPMKLAEVQAKTVGYLSNLQQLREAIYNEPDITAEIRAIGDGVITSLENITDKMAELEALFASLPETSGLTETEIIKIGLHCSIIFQILHEIVKRSYKDFQLKNIYYDRSSTQVKILDWNVVSEHGRVDAKSDILKLAFGLFYLLTNVSLETEESPERLYALGGLGWTDQTSQAVQMVLERVLVRYNRAPFSQAYQWPTQKIQALQPLSQCQAFGNALQTVLDYQEASLLDLLFLGQECMLKELTQDAFAVAQIALRRLESEPPSSSKINEDLQNLMGKILESLQLPQKKLAYAQEMLRASDREKARQAIVDASQADPENITIKRWLVLINNLSKFKFDDFQIIWKTSNLQEGMVALAEQRWSKAREIFKAFSESQPELYADVELNIDLERLSSLFGIMLSSGNLETIAEFLKQLEELDNRIANHQPPYQELVLRKWPDRNDWRNRAQTFYQQLSKKQKYLDELKG